MTFALLLRKPLMTNRRWFSALVLAAVVLTSGCGSDENASTRSASRSVPPPTSTQSTSDLIQSPDDPEPVPDVTLETMEGESIALANRPGEVLLVNFWATWCPPCRKEIPDLIALQKDLGPQGLTVIGVSLDQQGGEVVTSFLDNYTGDEAINYPIVLDPEGEVEQAFGGVYGLPMTYVVGPDGRVHHRVLGLFPVEEMRPKLTAMLTESGQGAMG